MDDDRSDTRAFPESVAEPLPRVTPVSLPRELGELTRALLTAATVDGVLERIILAARYLIPAADVVSITLREENGDYYTPAETDAEGAELDRRQYETGEGPCIDAADPGGPAYAHSADLATESAWPAFAREATEHGFAAVLSTALITVPEPPPFTAALNIYSRERGALGEAARDTAFLLATYASLALGALYRGAATERALSRSQADAANLRKALDTRTVIGQATGILMARRRLSADEAFDVLVRASQNHNIKLAHLAELLARHPDTADRI
ncbi:GAF and ANTAR domain-containing protein [Actinoallomurus sp. NBC_01490]|uniref:GAF and ANTAR domain-containing protein n=1 Tax=Actinoallomurus sp. NBC_01490 TaxID=2903557 RepID=UPI002E30AD54|nr:GAF and ANTAR domain-containing protein [Actinoallomurus sp. NBC_01490]